LLAMAGIAMWRARSMPCPTDPALARACTRLRSLSRVLYIGASLAFVLGVTFAFVLPRLNL